jgi:hypothetical protein
MGDTMALKVKSKVARHRAHRGRVVLALRVRLG